MSQDPLLTQIAERCRTFSAGTGVSLNSIASLIGMSSGNFSAFLHGRSGLSARVTIKLLQLLNMSAREVQMKLSKSTGSRVEHFQSRGQPQAMKLDGSGWVTGQSGEDPNDSTGIDNTWKEGGEPSGDDLLDTLRQVDNFHRLAREAIAGYIANVQKAKVNKSGSTESPRTVDTNRRSSLPGPKGDQYSEKTPEQMRDYLKWLKAKREVEELRVRLEDEISAEAKSYMNARMELGKRRK
jgi:hypothetical protein